MTSTTTPATVDSAAETVERTVFIRSSPQSVWDALTVPELIAEWFADAVELDAVVAGAEGVLSWTEHGDFPFTVVEVDEPRVFAFRWNETGDAITDENSTVARFALTEEPGGTLLHLVESGFGRVYPDAAARATAMDGNRGGWDSELDALAAVLERQDSQ